MKTATDRQKSRLIRKYHTLCTKIGMTEEDRREMLSNNYGVESSKDLYVEELEHLCNVLNEDLNNDKVVYDVARKRVIKILFLYLPLTGYLPNMDYVKETARKAAKADSFNAISLPKLKQLYKIFGEKYKKKEKEWSEDILNKIAEDVANGIFN